MKIFGLSLLLLLFLNSGHSVAQNSGIRGYVRDAAGNPVPFASVGIEKSSQGGMANEEGEYRLPLPPGDYVVYFQCLGYKSERREVSLKDGFRNLDVQLTEQILQTREVLIAPGNEDPAYAIMRKAIARARINKMLLDAYTAEVYVRGGGRILEVPFLMKGLLKNEGIDPNTVFFKETLESLEYRQPNTYIEKVQASRSNFPKAMEVQQNFLKYELYSPKFGKTASPLSPSAFRYYRFQYLGAFTDYNREIFKIKVIPRSPGQHIWSGEISIVDGLWCIHSANLEENGDGFDIRFKQEYSPVEGIWLPHKIRQEVKGKLLGITAEFTYNASVRKYRITKNEKLYADYKKLEQKLDEQTDEIIRANPEKPDLKKQEKDDRKMLKQLAKAYLKEKLKGRKKENREKSIPASVVANRIFIEDSTSVRKDSVFWEENRLVPLTEMEVKSFRKMDSIYTVQEKKDSVRKGGKTMKVINEILLGGKTILLGKPDSLKRKPVELKVFSPAMNIGFNAVEGYSLQSRLWLKKYFGQSTSRMSDSRPYLQFGPDMRYSFARNKLLLAGTLQYGKPAWTAQIKGGSAIRQINAAEPIDPKLNFIYAVYAERNFMKVYQADFIRFDFLRKLTGRLEVEAGFGIEDRIQLVNSRTKRIWGREYLNFEENDVNVPAGGGISPVFNRLAELRLALDWYPFMVSALFNESQFFRLGNSPAIRFEIRHAVPGIYASKADFTRAEAGWRQSIGIWKETRLEIGAKASAFLRKENVSPMDALHILGNQTIFIDKENLMQFRNLPYYAWSNASRMAEIHAQLYSDKLILGWVFPERKKWREVLLCNALSVPGRPVFSEFGYGVDRLFRILHLNVVRSQAGNTNQEWRFMMGLSYFFSVSPKSYDRSPGVSSEN